MFGFFHSLFLQMVAFFQTVFTFYHQGFELAKDFAHYKTALQINIQNVRNTGSSWRWNWNRCNSNYWIIEIDTNVWQFALVEIINEISFFFFSPRQGTDLRVHGQRCMSSWRGSGRLHRSTDRPVLSAVKVTFMYRKNVRHQLLYNIYNYSDVFLKQ